MTRGQEALTVESETEMMEPTATHDALESAGESQESPAAEQGAPTQPVADVRALEEQIVDVLRTIYDPEIPVNIYDLGLVYKVDVDPEAHVAIEMTLTAPGCPVAGSMPGEVERKVLTVPGVASVHVELVWEPAWNMNMLSEEAKLTLGFF